VTRFLALLRKDLLLALRDWHGLLLLFAMPAVFIVVMSLALQEQLGEDAQQPGIQVLVVDESGLDQGQELIASVRRNQGFLLVTDRLPVNPREAVARDEFAFLLTIADAQASGGSGSGLLDVAILVGPGTSSQVEALFTAAVGQAMGLQSAELAIRSLRMAGIGGVPEKLPEPAPIVTYSIRADHQKKPSSVQQNVPAWLVFGMFFTVIPLSNAVISERQQGTLRRLRTIAMPRWLPVLTKLVPYFIINLVQAVLMLASGAYLVPALGGEVLSLGGSPTGLLFITASVSVAALGYGMVIAVLARTTDQAVTLGGAGNIILGAIGGIMVPRFIMPEAMRNLSLLSPMSWGLDGFLDIILRNGGVADVLPECAVLAAFGATALAIAVLAQLRQTS
jgi:ABC-2 type transport system permease protein